MTWDGIFKCRIDGLQTWFNALCCSAFSSLLRVCGAVVSGSMPVIQIWIKNSCLLKIKK